VQALPHLVAQHALAAVSTNTAPCAAVQRRLTGGPPAIEQNLQRRRNAAASLQACGGLPQRHDGLERPIA
jgi:hypothetical protein